MSCIYSSHILSIISLHEVINIHTTELPCIQSQNISLTRRERRMGQSMKKLANGRADEKKEKEIGPVIEEFYNTHLANANSVSTADFYRVVCETVEEINKKIAGTQLRVPSKEALRKAFEPLEKNDTRGLFFWKKRSLTLVPHEYQQDHHEGKGKSLTKEEFGKILKDVIFDTGFLGSGAKDILFYIFGVPMTTLLIKQRLAPKALPNELFIPVVTSATVFVLAKLNKI